TLYGLAVAYVALNAGLVRVLSSPLTLTMIRGAGGRLADSIQDSVTPSNAGAMALVVAAGVALPAALLRWRPGRGLVAAWIGVSLILIACGPYAISQVDTGGRYRNAFGGLWPVRVTSPGNSGHENWRKSPFPVAAGSAGDLVSYRGAASGRNVVMILLES